MKPALLDRLRRLVADGAVPASQLSASMRRSLGALFDGRILVERRVGAGRRVVVEDAEALQRWIEHRLPDGLDPVLEGPPRAAAVAAFRDAKVAARTDAEPMLLRAFTDRATLEVDGERLDMLAWTRLAGCASVLLTDEERVKCNGRIGVVENLEAFVHAERLGAALDAAMYAQGRLSRRRLAWMAEQTEAEWVHLGDYDPVGVSEYLRVVEACPGRTSLFVPPNLDDLVRRYSKSALMEASAGVWATVRRSEDPAVRRVVEVLERHARGLEHEILIQPTDDANSRQ